MEVVIDKLAKLDLVKQGEDFGKALVSGSLKVLDAVASVKDFLSKERAGDGIMGALGRFSERITSGRQTELKDEYVAKGDAFAGVRTPGMNIGGMNSRTGGGDPENELRDRMFALNFMRVQMERFQQARQAPSAAFFRRMQPVATDLGAAVKANGTFRDGTSTTATGAFGTSATGLNVDTAEQARARRRNLFEDARFTNPLATGPQLNQLVNQQMQQERDKKRADTLRETINAKRRARGEEELQAPKTAAEENAAAIAKALEPLYKQQTTDIQSTVAR